MTGNSEPRRPRVKGGEHNVVNGILLHDYCGHPFQLQLAEELAARGNKVEHVYCGSNPQTPHALDGRERIDSNFRSRAIHLPKPISKGAFAQRVLLEREYGRRLSNLILDEQPEVVILANTPIDALAKAIRATRKVRGFLIIWVQDLLGEAALRILPGKIGSLGRLIGSIYRRREARLLAKADHLISITGDFVPFFSWAGIPEERWTTIPNWAPLDKVKPCDKVNSWSIEHRIQNKTVFLYSGSLGFKHNPQLLLDLAEALRNRNDAIVVVNSEGDVADWLLASAAERRLNDCLQINGYQPFDRISEVLGSADVLITLLEPDAGAFSVPSKVLSNHCAARPQLLAVPEENLAAKIVKSNQSGIVVDPRDGQAFVKTALELLNKAELRDTMGTNARQYAMDTFRIGRIANQFEDIFRSKSLGVGALGRGLA